MTIKELLEMEIHEEYVFNRRIVIRVPGGWIYETEVYKNGVYTGRMTSCFVPEPRLQTNNGYDGCSAIVELDPPEPDYDKTAQSEKDFLTMGRWN
ncbi:MAG: hypothetical protein PHX12_05875 [Proteiniphilum sp.]|nr:hypothetical protein [Proteiniphilum sp.]